MRKSMVGAMAALLMAAAPAVAQERDVETNAQRGEARIQVENEAGQRRVRTDAGAQQENQRLVAKAMRVSRLMDLEVRDVQNEELGEVEDIVLDLESGEVRYVALSVGGVLGVGDKLFAVPWQAFKVQQLEDEWVLTLNASKEKFENAPGFEDNNWPNMADQNWQTTNDRYYSDQGVTVNRGERSETLENETDVRIETNDR